MKQYKLLIIAIIFIPLLSGCLFEDQPVPDPTPADGLVENTPIDINNKQTFNGKYVITDMDIKNLPNNEIMFPYMYGYFNLKENSITGNLDYTYATKYNGYQTKGNFLSDASNTSNIITNNIEVQKDNYTIKLKQPIQISDNGLTYEVKSLIKASDVLSYITDNKELTEDANIVNSTLCDPLVNNSSDKDCSTVIGAMKYVGYYRIENITCNNQTTSETKTYKGGIDFTGEMTASFPNISGTVVVPITTKIQIKNNELKTCLLKKAEQEQNNNLYYSKTDYSINLEGLSIKDVFNKMGLVGIKDKDELIRNTQIIYNPKNNTDFTDVTFGDNNNKVSMRLLIMDNINIQPVRTLEKIPYTTQP